MKFNLDDEIYCIGNTSLKVPDIESLPVENMPATLHMVNGSEFGTYKIFRFYNIFKIKVSSISQSKEGFSYNGFSEASCFKTFEEAGTELLKRLSEGLR